eukprot:13660410-Alexandrium_andersonii.AAC.1
MSVHALQERHAPPGLGVDGKRDRTPSCRVLNIGSGMLGYLDLLKHGNIDIALKEGTNHCTARSPTGDIATDQGAPITARNNLCPAWPCPASAMPEPRPPR